MIMNKITENETVLSKDEFQTKLEEVLNIHVTLDHPIFEEFLRPEPNWLLLRMMTLQAYQITKHFLEYVENLYFYCPNPIHKRRLLINLYEEETGRISKTKNHVSLMEDFIRAIGISDKERDSVKAFPETQELIDYRMEHVRNQDKYHMGAAAVMIASEGQSLETKAGEAKDGILSRIYNLKEEDLLFFTVHAKEDVGHVKEGLAVVSDLCTTAEMQKEAIEAVRHTCNLFRGMYDSVARQYYAQKAP